MEFLHLTLNAVAYRRKMWNGKPHLIVPITMIVPGVLNGSQGSLYYPPDEVAANPGVWNDIPLTHYHPSANGYNVSASAPGIVDKVGLGVVRGDHTRNGKRRCYGWFDEDKTLKVAPEVHDAIINGRKMEISTGLYTVNVPAEPGANFKGRPYEFVAKGYRPDHLAILPAQVGACSVNDGCGLNVNSNPTGINQYTVEANAASRSSLKLKGHIVGSRLAGEEGIKASTKEEHESAALRHEHVADVFHSKNKVVQRDTHRDAGAKHRKAAAHLGAKDQTNNAAKPKPPTCPPGGT